MRARTGPRRYGPGQLTRYTRALSCESQGGRAFEPGQLTVKAGTTVTWVNDDDIPHIVVATGKTFRSKALDTNDKFSFTFATPGSYEYFCSLHPYMKATVTVTQ
jgi:plastocyanin